MVESVFAKYSVKVEKIMITRSIDRVIDEIKFPWSWDRVSKVSITSEWILESDSLKLFAQ